MKMLATALLTLALTPAVCAQSPLAAAAAAEAARRDVAAGKGKVYTNKDLPATPSAVPTAPPTAADLANPERQDAIASLRAVQSILAGGANAGQFRTYYLDAKVKVDVLPRTPENAAIYAVSTIYADAVALSIAWQTERLTSEETHALRQKYSYDAAFPFETVFSMVPFDGFGQPGQFLTSGDVKRAALGAQAGGQMLLHLAETKLKAVQ